MVPWLDHADQEIAYPPGLRFNHPNEQREYVRNWLRLDAHLPTAAANLDITFYAASYHDEFSGVLVDLGIVGDVADVLELTVSEAADLFKAEGLTRDLVYLFCGPLSLLFFFNALIFVANALCNNLGAAFQSTLVNWGRHTLGTVPFALWLAMYWGPQGVLIGQAGGGIVFGILAVFLALRVIDRRAATL